ncbi:MAG: uroporphyrinogen decarboxylase family protein [Planctomycetota bacterium]
MNRKFYLDLAKDGIRFPIGSDLVLHEKPNHQVIVKSGEQLGKVVEETARRFKTPLAIPLMDLMVEKEFLLAQMGVPETERATFHFNGLPEKALRDDFAAKTQSAPFPVRLQANIDAVSYIAGETDLRPVGMVIGPFSLMTKLFSDPITPVYIAGTGVAAGEDAEVAAIEWGLEVATLVILRSVEAQIKAGAKVIMMAEPAANKVFFSPKQMAEGSDIFSRYCINRVRQIKQTLDRAGVDFILHDCGELTNTMLQEIAAIDPVILSLGSSRCLWEDAKFVGKNTVLYGNLPTKRFIQDSPTKEEIVAQAREIVAKMKAVDHPFILGSECDVLSVPGYEELLREKVSAFLNA